VAVTEITSRIDFDELPGLPGLRLRYGFDQHHKSLDFADETEHPDAHNLS
jgi:hypothetical protein